MNKFTKIILTIAFTYWWLEAPTAFAQTDCASRLLPAFTPAQAERLCSEVKITNDLISFTGTGGNSIGTSTVDAADSSFMNLLSYGGTVSGDATRGGYLSINGNEVATVGGFIQAVLGGTASNFTITGNNGATILLDIEDSGDIATFNGTVLSTATSSIGWAVVAGANVACNTTCTNACVFGVNTAATEADIVACTDATADECLCAGAS